VLKKKSLHVALLVCSAAFGPLPDPRLSFAGPVSSHQLTIVVCEEGPGDLCTDLKKIGGATVIIDDREAGRTNEDGSLTTMVQRGRRTLHIAAIGYAGVEIPVEVSRDTHHHFELKPTPLFSRVRAED
jgi:PEGA domain